MFLSGNLIIWVVESHGSGSANQMCSCWGWYSGQDVYADLIYHRQLPRGICPYSVSMSASDKLQTASQGICLYSVGMSQTASQGNVSLHCQLSSGICPYSVGMSKKSVWGGGMSWQWSMKQQIPMGICSYSVSMSQTASYGNYNTSLLCTYVHVNVSRKASHREMCPNSVISVTESFPWEISSYVVWLPHIWKAFHVRTEKCTHIVGKSLKASIGSISLECKYFKESFPLEYVLKISMSQRESNWEMSVQLKYFSKFLRVYLQTASHGNMSVCVSMSQKAFHAGIYPNRVRVSLSQKALSFPLEYVPSVQVSDRKLLRKTSLL